MSTGCFPKHPKNMLGSDSLHSNGTEIKKKLSVHATSSNYKSTLLKWKKYYLKKGTITFFSLRNSDWPMLDVRTDCWKVSQPPNAYLLGCWLLTNYRSQRRDYQLLYPKILHARMMCARVRLIMSGEDSEKWIGLGFLSSARLSSARHKLIQQN